MSTELTEILTSFNALVDRFHGRARGTLQLFVSEAVVVEAASVKGVTVNILKTTSDRCFPSVRIERGAMELSLLGPVRPVALDVPNL